MLQGVRGFFSTGITPYRSGGAKTLSTAYSACLLSLALVLPAHADTLWLENGDIISGEILQLDAGKLKIKTDYAGTFEIDWRHVRSVKSSEPLWITLVGEKEPQRRRLNAQDAGVEIQSEDGEEIHRFSTVWTVAAIHQEKPVLADSWQFGGELRVGIDSKTGNTNREIYTFEGELNLDDQWNKNTLLWDLETKHYTTSDVEEWMVGYSYNRFLDERIYIAGNFDWSYDSGADERNRALAGIGVGYRFWETSQRKLQTSFGITRFWERYLENPNQDDYGLAWVINYRTQIWKNLSYYNDHKFFYRFSAREKLLDMRHGFRVALNSRVSLRVSHTLDYDSQALTSVEKFDSQIKLTVGYQW